MYNLQSDARNLHGKDGVGRGRRGGRAGSISMVIRHATIIQPRLVTRPSTLVSVLGKPFTERIASDVCPFMVIRRYDTN